MKFQLQAANPANFRLKFSAAPLLNAVLVIAAEGTKDAFFAVSRPTAWIRMGQRKVVKQNSDCGMMLAETYSGRGADDIHF